MSGGIKLWEHDEQAYFVPTATETTKTVKKTTKTTIRREITETSGQSFQEPFETIQNHVGQPQHHQQRQEQHHQQRQEQHHQQRQGQHHQQRQGQHHQQRQEQHHQQRQEQHHQKRQQPQQNAQGGDIWASPSPQIWGSPQETKQQVPQSRQNVHNQQQQQQRQPVQKPNLSSQPTNQQRQNQNTTANQQIPAQNIQRNQQQPVQTTQASQPQSFEGSPLQKARQMWNDPPPNTQPRKIEFEETEQERLRKQQQQQYYRKMREQQEQEKLQLQENKRRAQQEREQEIREGATTNDEDDIQPYGTSTVELRPAPAPLDSDLWPPKQSNMQPLPRTGFYPQEVRREQDMAPKKAVWPPIEDDEDDDDAPAGVRGGVARSYIPPSTAAVDVWNPQSPGTSRRLPEWAKYRPQRKCANDIWPPREAVPDDQVELERPEPRKSHRFEYLKMGSKVPVTYHSPPGTQHTSIEGRYPYAT